LAAACRFRFLECQRNIEVIWLTGQLAPDFKTIADFRKDNGAAIRKVCREFVVLCRKLDLLSMASVAIDGSKFKAVNARDKNFTEAKMKRRLERSQTARVAPSPNLGQQPEAMSLGLTALRQSVDQLAASLGQMRNDVINLQTAQQAIFDKVSESPPRPAAAPTSKPPPRPSQTPPVR
jgi:hypothetical protein